MFAGKPIKAKNLKVIEYIGSFYATFDGTNMWKIDPAASNILNMCDGRRSLDSIITEASNRIGYKPEEVRPVVEKILAELTEMGFVQWIE